MTEASPRKTQKSSGVESCLSVCGGPSLMCELTSLRAWALLRLLARALVSSCGSSFYSMELSPEKQHLQWDVMSCKSASQEPGRSHMAFYDPASESQSVTSALVWSSKQLQVQPSSRWWWWGGVYLNGRSIKEFGSHVLKVPQLLN